MSRTIIPPGYKSCLDLYDTQTAIGFIKRTFEDKFSKALHLKRVSAPLFVDPALGLNDNLSGVERPVSFDLLETGQVAEVVHSLAKWKRLALYRYDFFPGNGLYTDMNAIRRDETLTNLHSIYVDQWDWEKVIPAGRRDEAYLYRTVQQIVGAICDTQDAVHEKYGLTLPKVNREVTFITSQELADRYPGKSGKEREYLITKEAGTVFIQGIGGVLTEGAPHDSRAPDYDDWNLNGDILFWNPVLEDAIELSSMGIRVDPEAMDRQLAMAGCDDRRELYFHKLLLEGKLPLTIGGGIGQSRMCLLILGKAHIGEVQSSVWDPETRAVCEAAGVVLL